MSMDKYGCFMQYMFIISETIVNIEHEEHVSQVIDVFQRTCSCLLDTWKKEHENTRFLLFLSLHWAIYWHKPVYIFALQVSLLLNMQNVGYIYYYICLSLCATYCIFMQLNSH